MRIVKVFEPTFIEDDNHEFGGTQSQKEVHRGYFHGFHRCEDDDLIAVVEIEDGTIIEPLACRIQFIDELI